MILNQLKMPFEGVHLVLGYKISEKKIKEMFPDHIVYSSSYEDGGSSEEDDGFDFYSFKESINEFLAKKTKKYKIKFECHSLECCSYRELNRNWILGVKIGRIDGLDLKELNLNSGEKYIPALELIFEKLKIKKYCKDTTPHIYALADGCINCS